VGNAEPNFHRWVVEMATGVYSSQDGTEEEVPQYD
jgi:hypothetical protein